MATITLKSVPQSLVEKIKHRAAENRRSMNSEIITRLQLSLAQDRTFDAQAYWKRIDEITKGIPPIPATDDELREMKNMGRP